MSFLQPILLVGLPLALLPVLIHLINQHRHRTQPWAAMMFLLEAKKMTKGLARLRQFLILAMRVLALATLVLAASRPLAGGWVGLTGGKADTLLVLLDRSASMEQRNLETGESKRSVALDRIAKLIETTGHRGEIVLIDSATLMPTLLSDAQALRDLAESAPTTSSADLPALLRQALHYLSTQESGRTDLWILSDLQQADWNPSSGEWESIRTELAARETVRLFLLTYPEEARDNVSVAVRGAKRVPSGQGHALLLDLVLRRQGPEAEGQESSVIPVEFTVNGTRTVEPLTMTGNELVLFGHPLPLGPGNDRGWGRIDLPADDNPADNTAFFVFDEPTPRHSVILSDDPISAEAIRAAASAASDAELRYEATVLDSQAVSQIPWEETALLFWQAPLPDPSSTEAALLQQHVAAGRSLILLPPSEEGGAELFGIQWGDWVGDGQSALNIDWWRTETGLLSNTRSGDPLPVAELNVFRARRFTGEHLPLLRLENELVLIARALPEPEDAEGERFSGAIHIWGSLPRSDHSNLASEGIVFYAMTHRALEAGAAAVSRARFLETTSGALTPYPQARQLDQLTLSEIPSPPDLSAGAWEAGSGESGRRLLALNRPEREDDPRRLQPEALEALFAGVPYRLIDDRVGTENSLASEIWRLFLTLMACALLVEAILSLPPKPVAAEEKLAGPIHT